MAEGALPGANPSAALLDRIRAAEQAASRDRDRPEGAEAPTGSAEAVAAGAKLLVRAPGPPPTQPAPGLPPASAGSGPAPASGAQDDTAGAAWADPVGSSAVGSGW